MQLNKKRISIGYGLLGLVLIIFSLIELSHNVYSMIKVLNIIILKDLFGPFINLFVGLYLMRSRKRLLTFFIKENDDEYWNITYLIIVFIGSIYMLFGVCDLLTLIVVQLFGDFGVGLIDIFVDNYSIGDFEIRTPFIYVIIGIGIMFISPMLTQYIIRKEKL